MKSVWIILFIFFVLCFNVTANTFITGQVFDAETKKPLSSVNIFFENSVLGSSSDNNGRYQIRVDSFEQGCLVFTCVGYEQEKRKLDANESGEQELHIYLKPTVIQLNKNIVVTANRSRNDVFNVVASVSVMEKGQLDRRLPRSTPEGLIETSGVWMQKTNHGGGSPFIRGLVGNQVLILVDGVRLNNATFRYGPNQYLSTIDPFTISRVEALRGSGSVLYGTDALGGVINLLTKEPQFINAGYNISGDVYSRFMSHGMEKTGRSEIHFQSPAVAVIGGFSRKNFGDIYAGGGIGKEAPSGYEESDWDVKTRIKLFSKGELTVAHQNVYQDDVPRYDKVFEQDYKTYSFDPQIRRLSYLKYITDLSSKWIQQVSLNLSRHESIEERKKQKREDPLLVQEEDKVKTFGINLDVLSRPYTFWKVNSGVDYYKDYIHSWRKDIDTDTGQTVLKRGLYPDDSKAENLAVFVTNDFALEKFNITCGARFNHTKLNFYNEGFGYLENNSESFVTTLGLGYFMNQTLLFGSVSQGFRAPNINDVSSLGEFDYGTEVPSPDLSPEKSVNMELGVKSRFDSWSFAGSVYRNDLTNLIDRVKSTYLGQSIYEGLNVYKKQNIDKAYIYGYEMDMEVALLKNVVFQQNLIYTYGETSDSKEPLRRIPPLYGKSKIKWQVSSKLWYETDLQYAGKQDRLSSGDIDDHRIPEGGTPGWQILNMYMGYSFQNLDVSVGAQNLFNKAYRIHGSGVEGYGRSFWIGLHFKS